MSKRNSLEKIEHLQAKIKKLQEKHQKSEQRRRRVVIFSDSSDSENDSDILNPNNETLENCNDGSEVLLEASVPQPEDVLLAGSPEAELHPQSSELPSITGDSSATEQAEPTLDTEFLTALGDTVTELPAYGENIHQYLAQRWLPILRRGLSKESKDALLKEYTIPANCKLLRAPWLNPEISAAITDLTKARDKKLETAQQQLGLGITAINKAMSVLFTGEDKQSKVQAIKLLSDGCRILSDLHFTETKARIKLITPSLDKTFLNIVQDVERDESLFGNKLSEKIKASKTIEKQGLQIKKSVVVSKTPQASSSHSSSRPRPQGNWAAPPRYQQSSHRGGRGGPYKIPTPTSSRKPAPPVTPAHNKSSNQTKLRALTRQ